MAGMKKLSVKKASKAKVKSSKPAAIAPRKVGFDKVSKPRTKSQIFATVADNTGMSKRDVKVFFETLKNLIGNDLGKGPGVFTLPGLLKMTVARKPATKARKGINPFTGEEMMFKAKPARNVVRARALKALKDVV